MVDFLNFFFLNLYLLNLYVSISIGCGVLHSPVESIIKVVLRNLKASEQLKKLSRLICSGTERCT